MKTPASDCEHATKPSWRRGSYRISADTVVWTGENYEPYDPWDEWEDFRNKRRGSPEPPYLSFVRLGNELKKAAPQLDSPALQSIEDWCCGHGLLGLLPLLCQSIWLWPRWDPGGQEVLWRDGETSMTLGGYVQRGFIRDGATWQEIVRALAEPIDADNSPTPPLPEPNQHSSECDPTVGSLMPVDQVSGLWPAAGGVLLKRLGSFGLDWEPLDKGIGRFFPKVAAEGRLTHEYPLPLSDEFWTEYGEPVADFAIAARGFSGSYELLSSSEAKMRALGRATLRGLCQPATILTGNRRPGRKRNPRPRWDAGSLLSAYALMLLADANEGFRIYLCKACGMPCMTKQWQAAYCNSQCRWRRQKQRERNRRRRKARP